MKLLVRENYDLHLEIIKIRDDFERREIALSNSISKLDKEKQEMLFLIIQKDTHIRNKENEAENLRKYLNEVREKVYGNTAKSKKGILNNSAVVAKILNKNNLDNNSNMLNTIGKRQEMLMPHGWLNPSDFEFPSNVRKIFKEIEANKDQQANYIKACDERSGKFTEEIKKLEDAIKNLISKIYFSKGKWD